LAYSNCWHSDNSPSYSVYGIGGALLFSGYVGKHIDYRILLWNAVSQYETPVYDTYMITKRLSPDEYIMGAIALYLDFINLFLSILRVLNNVNRD
jgi:hypothetical protein